MIFEIKSIAGILLFSAEAKTLRIALEKAVKDGASLVRANLEGANLEGANLYGANLNGANLNGANLVRANLVRANLNGAKLEGANLNGASLVRANLEGANLEGANIYGANIYGASLVRANLNGANLEGANIYGASLEGASLEGANLNGANLNGANLEGASLEGASLPSGFDWLKPVRDDLRAVLDVAPHEASGLLAALWAGKVNGSTYEGVCACLVGTIANLRHEDYRALKIDLKPNSSRPAEIWFLKIRQGDTPINSSSAAFAAAVIAQWQHDRASAKPKRKVVGK